MIEIVEKYSYFGFLLILFVEEAGFPLPIPGGILIAAGVFLTEQKKKY